MSNASNIQALLAAIFRGERLAVAAPAPPPASTQQKSGSAATSTTSTEDTRPYRGERLYSPPADRTPDAGGKGSPAKRR